MKKLLYMALPAVLVLSSVTLAQPGWRGPGSGGGPQWQHAHAPGPGQGMGMHHRGAGAGMLLAMADEIGLTDQQKDRLEQMIMDFKLEKIDRQAEIKKAQINLCTLRRDKNAVEAEVMRAIDNVSQLRAELQKLRYRHHKAVRDLLTGSQVKKLQELRQQRMKDRPGMGRGQGMGSGKRSGRAGLGCWYYLDSDSDI